MIDRRDYGDDDDGYAGLELERAKACQLKKLRVCVQGYEATVKLSS